MTRIEERIVLGLLANKTKRQRDATDQATATDPLEKNIFALMWATLFMVGVSVLFWKYVLAPIVGE